ncbi:MULTISPECIES: ABC transporter substrate-binding protein [unclassified Pseudomonas]|uniref:cytochrome c/ABC transporter substrate-binding protein n=1 Tax=unclassified Pseudomonas TaxID=196821 RepID=UPI00244C65C4|nr:MULTISPECIES: ABC transporter substrate-binding protein [unclassified Pseudomonas]MDH0301860.1 ABC transporter substrate-binding protein [Pseudomonas sp. GD04091]MDH1983852.1 ABC transporter substrate-binding protein [Pseudomonas sp. GD03689]
MSKPAPALVLLVLWLCLWGPAQAAQLNEQEQAGKRLYREGVSSSDAQLLARVGPGDMSVPASVLPCASCHGNDGRGRSEGGVRPPNLDWQRLALGSAERESNSRRYPAYSDASLARVIRSGIDPAGNRLDPAMPRFDLSLADQRNLLAYLKRLGEDHDPGVEEGTLRLGTLLPQRGPLAEAGRTVRAVLEDGIEQLNRQGGIHGRRLQLIARDPGLDPSSTAQALDNLIRQERIFALIAPLAPLLDGRQLEQAGLPLIGATPRGGGNAQVFDPLPGVPEQLLSVALHARDALGLAPDALRVVHAGEDQAEVAQVVSGRMRQLGFVVAPAQAFTGQAPEGEGIVFVGRAQAFAELASSLQAIGRHPYLLAVSGQVAGAVPGLAPVWSQRVLLAYPFVPGDWTAQGRATLAGVQQRQGLEARQASLQVSTLSAWRLLVEALRQVGRDASREQLLDALERLHDVDTGLTPLLGFGPGRRQGMAGAHVVKVSLPGPAYTEVAPYRPVPQSP